ncbi:MAG: BolA family transcriptional regulator [Xanthomonadales bacterium]|nr:BolA family transcriptional regulator [Xanthomonadales bacterium]
MNRVATIDTLLRHALAPAELIITDEGHKHVGHAGARDGRGHFHVRIVSDAFKGKTELARQRMVFSALGNMMQTDIHALGVDARTTEET